MVSYLHPYFQEVGEVVSLVEDVLLGVQAVMEVAYHRVEAQEGEAFQADLQHLQVQEAFLEVQSRLEGVEHWEHLVHLQTADAACLPGTVDSGLQVDVLQLSRDALPLRPS